MRADPAFHQTAPLVRMRACAAGLGQAVAQQVDGGAQAVAIERAVQRGDKYRLYRQYGPRE